MICNTDNSNIQLVNGKACNQCHAAEECAETPPARLNAGNAMVVPKQAGQSVICDPIFLGKSTWQVFKR